MPTGRKSPTQTQTPIDTNGQRMSRRRTLSNVVAKSVSISVCTESMKPQKKNVSTGACPGGARPPLLTPVFNQMKASRPSRLV